MEDFLSGPSVKLNQEELLDIDRRKEMDRKRIEEQRQFYEVARQRAKELDIYMEKFRRDIVESSTSSYVSTHKGLCLLLQMVYPTSLRR